jgi:hypothetical protein
LELGFSEIIAVALNRELSSKDIQSRPNKKVVDFEFRLGSF